MLAETKQAEVQVQVEKSTLLPTVRTLVWRKAEFQVSVKAVAG